MAGLTSAGFETRRLPEIIEDQKARAKEIFQDLVPVGDEVDTSDSSTIGRLVGLTSPQFSDLWELAQLVYSAFDPNSAVGIALDNLVALNGTTRMPASATTADIVIWGDQGTLIVSGSQIASTNSDSFTIDSDTSISASDAIGMKLTLNSVVNGTTYTITIIRANQTIVLSYTANSDDTVATVLAQLQSQFSAYSYFTATTSSIELQVTSNNIYVPFSFTTNLVISKIQVKSSATNIVVGNIPLSPDSLTTISTPILGWDSVNNPLAGVTGSNEETDDELRERFRENKFTTAQNISDALYSDLIDIDGVSKVVIYDNNTDTTDADHDIPPHSFKVLILGGNTTEIANVIWKNQPLGISSSGDEEVEITDSQGVDQLIHFQRPTSVPVYITMDISALTSDSLPADYQTTIKASLIEYFNTLSLNSEVVYSRLYTPINQTSGFQVNELYIGTSPTPTGTSNISFDYDEYPTISSTDIIITVS